jgi:hypothetical protein
MTIGFSDVGLITHRQRRYNRFAVNTTPRTRKAFAVLCIAIVVVAAFAPSLASSLGSAILVPLWLVVPAVAVTVIRRHALRSDDQPVSLLAILDSRAPPILSSLI